MSIGLAYLASLASVIYSTRGRGQKALGASALSFLFVFASTLYAASVKDVAEAMLVVVVVSMASLVIFVVRRRKG